MEEHVEMLKEEGLLIPRENENPTVIIQNEGKSEAIHDLQTI